MLRAMFKQPLTLPPLPVAETCRCAVSELVNDFDECGRSVWREKYPEEEYRR